MIEKLKLAVRRARQAMADGSLTSLGEVGGLPVDDGAVDIAAR